CPAARRTPCGEPHRRVAVRGPEREQPLGRERSYEQREQSRCVGLEVAPPLQAIGEPRIVLAPAPVKLVEKPTQVAVHDRSIARRVPHRPLRSGRTTRTRLERRRKTMAENPKLYVCHGDDGGPKMHPCRRVQEAMRSAGIEFDKEIAAHGSPIPFLR